MKPIPVVLLGWMLLTAGDFATANPAGLPAADWTQLQRDKVLVASTTFKQSFTPYIDSELPVFVTSDAVLNAYHVLLDESLARAELRQSMVLPDLLDHLWQRLPKAVAGVTGDDALAKAAQRRATLVLAVAFGLLDRKAPGLPSDLAALAGDEVRKIEEARGTGKPSWLGLADPGFLEWDYSRFSPRGFYGRSDRLRRYFRCVAWLQAVPFRVNKREEFLAMMMLGNALFREQPRMSGLLGNWYIPPRFAGFFEAWRGFLGSDDNWDITALNYESRYNDDDGGFSLGKDDDQLARVAEEFLKKAKDRKRERINDQLAAPPAGPDTIEEPQFRLLSAYQLPDAVLFQQTTDLRTIKPPRPLPDGMEVAAALGSDFATRWLHDRVPEQVARVLETSRKDWLQPRPSWQTCLYQDYLNCLAALVDAPEPDAPDFMRGEAWQRKSCATVLGGWAQMRRTWVLQAKTNTFYAGLTEMVPGFVEPDPEFFQRLLAVGSRTLSLLQTAGAFADDPEEEVLADLRVLSESYHRWAAHPDEEENADVTEMNAPTRGEDRLTMFGMPKNINAGPAEVEAAPDEDVSVRQAKCRKAEAEWEQKVADFADHVLAEYAAADEARRAVMLKRLMVPTASSLHNRWLDFIDMVSRIESLAQKQLRKVPLSPADRSYMKDFGFTLARAMFYDSNSYESPRDDAMKVVDVFSGPTGNLHIAIGRPHAIYVLYPWQGKDILCIGAVLPYHEFADPARLTDADWKARLDGPPDKRPPAPAWYAPLLGEHGL